MGGIWVGHARRDQLGFRAQDAPEVEDNDTSPYHQALLAYKSSHYDEARTAIEAAEKAKPGDVPVTEILKARILTEQRRFCRGQESAGRSQGQAQLDSRNRCRPKCNSPSAISACASVSFDEAAKYYESLLQAENRAIPISRSSSSTPASALPISWTPAKLASQLKPLDPDHPSYYFAKAALAQATGKSQEAEEDIQTARTIYGITVSNRYLKTYLEVFLPASENKSPDLRGDDSGAAPRQARTDAAPGGNP